MGRKLNKADVPPIKSGFTLVEVMIVVAIISFLVILAVLAYKTQIFKGKDAKRKSDINRIQIAVEEYEKDYNCYPLPQLVVCDPGTSLRPYIDRIPCDPKTNASYYYEYEDSSCPSWYRFYAILENTNDPDVTAGIGPGGAFNYIAASPNAPAISTSPSGSTPPTGETPTPPPQNTFYGCKSGVCVPISWDPSRPGPECDPNYQNPSCYGQCGPQANECQSWQ